jgi:hypothetical protein
MKLTKVQEIALADAISPGCSVHHHNLNVLKALQRKGLIELPEIINVATRSHSVRVTKAGYEYQYEHLVKFNDTTED